MPLIASPSTLYGIGEPELVLADGFKMRPGTARAYLAMKEAAAADGVAMAVTSSYRDFERQLAIWNGKAEGKRPILDANGQPLDAHSLSDNALIDAILLWSALPGCSRHHLGTDIDVYAPDNISRDALKLELPEYEPHGPCHGLSCWLDANASRFGFFRPYQAGKSGVSPEPWHLSFAPEAEPLMAGFDLSALATHLERAPLALKSAVLLRLDELVERYVRFYAAPPVTEPSV